MDIIIRAFKEGGVFIIPIMICAVFALAIAAERLYYIMFRANINGTAFFAQIQKLIMANNIDRAIKLCNAEPNAALPRVLKSGLTRANRGDVEIENAMVMGADSYESEEQRAALLAEGKVPIGIGEGTVIKNAIIDKNARIGKNCKIINVNRIKEDRDKEGKHPTHGFADEITIITAGSTIPDGTII